VGFSIVTLDGRQGILAHQDIRSPHRVGKYGVNLQDIDSIAVPAMVAESDHVVVVDEIGKMECLSAMFRKSLVRVLEGPNTVVGTIALKGDAFMNAIKERPDSRVIRIFETNRDQLVEDVLKIVTNQCRPVDTYPDPFL
jgi:nucleoside-triphosphatase